MARALLLLLPTLGQALQGPATILARDDRPVLVELYYESFCPGCRNFITTMLYPAFDKLQDTGVLAVQVYPYGNAHEKQLPDGSWQFDCQHGDQECLGNLLEVCVLAHLDWDSHRYLPIISCMEGADSPVLAAKGCLAALAPALPYTKVKACAWGAEGNRLMHAVANRTESLVPAHEYVPWIVVQGQHTEELEQQATTDLVRLVCSLYTGTKPAQCDTQPAASSNNFIQRDWMEEQGAKSEVGDDTCVLCKYVISTLDGMLEDKSNEKEIKAALEHLCSFLPSAMKKQCDTFVEAYTDLIIDLLTKDVSPEMLCSNLGLCPDTTF